MTQEDKELLRKDLSARLPYGVKCKMWNSKEDNSLDCTFTVSDYASLFESTSPFRAKYCKPYLRPMSSMTEEEKEELNVNGFFLDRGTISNVFAITPDKGEQYSYTDIDCFLWMEEFFNTHHIDYRGLIEKGLAIEAPEGMYETE